VSSFVDRDTNPAYGTPKFNDPNNGNKYGFQLNIGSAVVNAGVAKQGPPIPGAGIGVFQNISTYPTEDFYGNPINFDSGTPNIGACNAKNGEISLHVSEEILNQNQIIIYPNPVKNILKISGLEVESSVKIYNTRGQLFIDKKTNKLIDISTLQKGVYFLKIENNKTIPFIKQ
jgi:hypothetical protein